MSAAERKKQYFGKLIALLDEYPRVLLVSADNVGSLTMQKVRLQMRGKGVLLMGKNTMIRKAIREHIPNNPDLEALLPSIQGNVGFIFTNEDPTWVAELLEEFRVGAFAKAGAIAPIEVTVPAGNTGLDPTQTSFLQALNIPSKIVKGQIEIVNDVLLFRAGEKVGSSEAALLNKLNIKPFSYGMELVTVYESGSTYDAALLKTTDEDVLKSFAKGVANIASISLAIGLPTAASLPHSIIRGYKNILAVSVATDYTIKQAEEIKALLADPEAMAAAAAAAAAPAAGAGADAAKEEAKAPEPEPESEEEEDMMGGLFD